MPMALHVTICRASSENHRFTSDAGIVNTTAVDYRKLAPSSDDGMNFPGHTDYEQ